MDKVTVALIKCPHCEKVGLNQQTGENKYWCKLCQRAFEVKDE
jgi:uncharacterized protein YbaR (Trm112 family)